MMSTEQTLREKDIQEVANNNDSQRWDEIVLTDNGDESSQFQSRDRTSLSLNEETLKMAMNITKESAQLVMEATPDFVMNTAIAGMISLLLFLILRKNGLEEDDLSHYLSLSCIWLSSFLGGYLIRFFRLPPLLGMIGASVILTNMIGTIQIPETWGETITSSGLAIILLLSGLELDLNGLKKSSGVAMRLTCVPGIVEAFVSGTMATFIFGMPFWLGLSLGFILAAVSPALVVVGMLKLQRLGYGVEKGIPSLIVAAASFDDIVAIAGFSVFIGLAIKSEDASIFYSAIHGPLSLMLGTSIGIACGYVLSM